jgi:hypothetical protein
MLHILNYDGQYFCIEVAEVANTDDSDRSVYVSWCSDAFRELKDAPSKACTRLVPGQPVGKQSDALRRAQDWTRKTWDSRQARPTEKPAGLPTVIYSVWLFRGDESSDYTFDEFMDAKTFAKAAEKIADITKVGIMNNESPQYLTIWEKPQ